MTIFDMQQFIAGTYHPTDEQLGALAQAMNLEPYVPPAAPPPLTTTEQLPANSPTPRRKTR